MNNKYLWVVIAVVVIVGLGGFLLLGNKASNTNQTGTATQNSSPTPTAKSTNDFTNNAVLVTSSGFEPQTITIKTGSKVVWTNNSGGTVTVNSDPHPTHTLWPFLNLGSFDDGSSVSVIFDKAGTYTYHNHLSPDQKGTVIVK